MAAVPRNLQEQPPRIWTLAQNVIGAGILNIGTIDGLIYGTGMRRINPLPQCFYGLLMMWQATHRKDYRIIEVVPRKGVPLHRLIGASWHATCFLMFISYNCSAIDDDLHKSYEIPDFSDLDLSSIGYMPPYDDDDDDYRNMFPYVYLLQPQRH